MDDVGGGGEAIGVVRKRREGNERGKARFILV